MSYKDKNKRREYYQDNKERFNQQRREYKKRPEVKKKMKEYARNYQEKNKDKLREQHKKYYQKNKEVIKERSKKYREKPEVKKKMKGYIRKYYKNNKEDIEKQNKTYRERNEEKVKEWGKNRYEKNKDYILKQAKENYLKDSKKKKKSSKEYYNKNKDKVREYEKTNKERISKQRNNYRKRRKLYDYDFRLKCNLRSRLWDILKEYSETGKIKASKEYGVYYNKIVEHLKPFPKNIKDYEVDHIIPLSKFDFNNLKYIEIAFAPENHQWLPKEINRWKGNRLIIPMTKEQQDKLLKKLR